MNERITIGGNNPPSEIEILKQRLASHTKEDELIDDLVTRTIPSEVLTDEMAGELADFIKSLKAARKSVENIFTAEKAPFFEACKVADAWKNVRWLRIDTCVMDASKPIIAWNSKKEAEEKARQAELARLAQVEAEKLAKEAEAHANAGINDTAAELLDFAIGKEDKAAAIIAKSEDVRGRSYGSFSSASSRKVWVGEIDNTVVLDLEALRKYLDKDSLDKAIRAAIKDGVREIRGVKIFEEDKLTIR